MMLEKLPVKISPISDAKRRLDYQGYYPRLNFHRIQECVLGILEDVEAKWSCAVDPVGRVVIEGTAYTRVSLNCERCLQSFDIDLNVNFSFSPVESANADELPDYYVELAVDEFGESNMLAAIEDELILGLPLVPMHELNDCLVKDQVRTFGTQSEVQKENPFAVLNSLKSKLKK